MVVIYGCLQKTRCNKGRQERGERMKITIKAARVNAGVRAIDAAKALDLSITAYSRKENGHARFYIDEAAKLSNLFDVPFQNFFEAECLYKTQ